MRFCVVCMLAGCDCPHRPASKEYFVARRYSERALLALAEIASVFHPFLLVSEIRTVAADELLLSRIPKASWGRPAALDFILHGA